MVNANSLGLGPLCPGRPHSAQASYNPICLGPHSCAQLFTGRLLPCLEVHQDAIVFRQKHSLIYQDVFKLCLGTLVSPALLPLS